MDALGSPFVLSALKRLPDIKIGENLTLVIRVESTTSTDRIVIKIGSKDASATNYNIYLRVGESIAIRGAAIKSLADISLFPTSGTPTVSLGVV